MKLNLYKTMPAGKFLLSFLAAVLLVSQVFAGAPGADITVSGVVSSSEDGTGLPGVNVYVKGTQTGTITDVNGRYSLSVADENGTLVFSYIGFTTQEVAIGGRTSIDIVMQANVESLGEVIVTALGITREERSLGYAVSKVDGEDIVRVPQENVVNSLAGRVPGVTVSSTGMPGSSVFMVIRGAKSLTNNQPLFVVDGVPMNNTVNNIGSVGSDNRPDYGNAIADINPDNVESITVLKGGAAAALYGSRAGNGVVMITTKTGAKAKKLTIDASTNNAFDIPYHYLPFHSKFGTGVRPYTPDANPFGTLRTDEGSVYGMGPPLDRGYLAIQWNSPLDEDGNPIPTELKSHPDNVKNFVRTGVTSTNSVAVSNSNDLISYRAGYTNMTNRGIIPNTDLSRHSFDLNSSLKLHEKVRVTTHLDYTRSSSDNRPAGNRGANPIQWAYYVSPHVDIRDLRNYWVEGQEGLQQLTTDNGGGEYNNPWFLAYEVNNSFVRDRVFGNVKADWQILPSLSLMGRYSLDQYTEQRESKIGNSYTNQPRGAYGLADLDRLERNIDFLLTYSKSFSDLSLSVSGGGNTMHQEWSDVVNATKNGTGLIIPGLFTLSNIAPANLDFRSGKYQKTINSVYGMVNLGYKDMVYLDLTARNDWSSTLPSENRSYFYPSATLSVLVNEFIPISDRIDMLKLRAAVAAVGNDTEPYSLYNTLGNAGAWGDLTRLSTSSTLLTPDLKPERLTNTEFGVVLKALNNRVRLEATYYTIESKNQIFPTDLPPSSGYSKRNINAGLFKSEGWEFAVGGTPIANGDWTVDVDLNYSWNRTTIEELYGDMKFFTYWTDAKGGAWTYVGEEVGDIYDAELVRVEDPNSPYNGYPILDEDGYWQAVRASNSRNKIGNFNPDFIMGGQIAASYKAFTFNLSFDWRKGGDFVSQTFRYGESDLKTQRWLDRLINPGDRSGDELRDWLVANAGSLIRDDFNIVGGPGEEYGGYPLGDLGDGVTLNDGVFNPGVFAEYDGDGNIVGYTENLGGPGTKYIPFADNYPWDFTKAATFDASFLKLREVAFGYNIPTSITSKIGLQRAHLSLFARNIMLWTAAKIGIDPETAFQPEAGTQGNRIQFKQGIERYNVTPWTISTGFKLSLTF